MNAIATARSIGRVIRGRMAPNCPDNPEHGPMLSWSGVDGIDWYCGAQSHCDVRKGPASRCFFSQAQVDAAEGRR